MSGAAAAGGAVALQHDAAAVARDAGGATAGAPAVPSEAGGAAAEEDDVPARSIRGGRNDVAAGSARGGRNDVVAGSADGAGNDVATGPARGAEDASARGAEDASARGAEDASARGAEDASARGAEDAKDAQEAPRAPRSVAGSTVSQRARDLLAYDADLVDPEVADPDLVGLDLDGTHTDLGLPPRPAGAPAEEETRTWFTARSRPAVPAAAEDRAERDADAHGDTAGSTAAGLVRDRAERDAGAHGDTAGTTAAGMDWDRADEAGDAGGEAGTDPEATVTLPTHPLSGAGRPPSPQAPAYGSYGGDDELHTERIAPLPFGRPPAQQQPARAFRAQPPSPPLDFKDERSRGDRRRRGLAALLAVVVLVAVVLAGGFLLIRSLRGSGDARAGGTPSATASLGPATIPSGYTRFAGSGFTVGVPVGWPAKEQRDGVVDAREPDSTRFLRMITVDSTAPALDQLSAAEKQFAADPSYGSYQRVRLEKIDYRGLNAADWEFTFTLDGVPRHVLYRGIVSDGRTFGLYLSTPADQWTNSTDVFRVAADTFRTG